MLIVAGEARMAPAAVDSLREAAARMVAATRAEAGCVTYSFAQDIADPGLVHIFEVWRDQAALDAHFASAHMAAFNAALGGVDITSIDVKTYEVSAVRS